MTTKIRQQPIRVADAAALARLLALGDAFGLHLHRGGHAVVVVIEFPRQQSKESSLW